MEGRLKGGNMQEAREEKKEKGVWLNLPGDVMRKLDWLAHHFNTTRASVLRWAIVSLYEEERKEDIVQLQQAPDGWWVLRDGEEEILKLRNELLDRFPRAFARQLQEGIPRGSAWPMVLLHLAKGKKGGWASKELAARER